MNTFLKELTVALWNREGTVVFDERIAKLKETQRGWLNYFRMAGQTQRTRWMDA